jgi:hypothetical protein
VNRVGAVVAPELSLELLVHDVEVAASRPLLEELAVRVERLGPVLLEADAAAVLLVERAIDFPLPDECGCNLLTPRAILLHEDSHVRDVGVLFRGCYHNVLLVRVLVGQTRQDHVAKLFHILRVNDRVKRLARDRGRRIAVDVQLQAGVRQRY